MTVPLSIMPGRLDGTRPLAELSALARAADEAGLDTLWVPDHLMQVAPGLPAALLVEAVTTLDVLSGGRAWFGSRAPSCEP